MIMKKNIIYPILSMMLTITSGCAQPINRSLQVTVKENNLCIFTGSKNTYSDADNSYLVFVGEVNSTTNFKSIYDKPYSESVFPVLENDCVLIPLAIFEPNKPYDINLESNKNFSKKICITENKTIIPVQYVVPGSPICSK